MTLQLKSVRFFSSSTLLSADRNAPRDIGYDVQRMMETDPAELTIEEVRLYSGETGTIASNVGLVGVDPVSDPEEAERTGNNFRVRHDELYRELMSRIGHSAPTPPSSPETSEHLPGIGVSEANSTADENGADGINELPNNTSSPDSKVESGAKDYPSNPLQNSPNTSSSVKEDSNSSSPLQAEANSSNPVPTDSISDKKEDTSNSKRKFEEEEGESDSLPNKKSFKQDSSDIHDDFSEMPGWWGGGDE